MNGQQRPGWYSAHANDYLNLRIFEGTLSLDVANRMEVISIPFEKESKNLSAVGFLRKMYSL